MALPEHGGKRVFLSRDSTTAGRPLNETEQRACATALEACRVGPAGLCARAAALAWLYPREPRLSEVRGPRSLVAHVALATRAQGIALGHRVYIRRELFGDDGALPIDLVAHEVTHVAQVLRDGLGRFLARYGAAYAAGRARGLDDRRAYLAIPYEVEARRVAARARPALSRA